EESVAPPGMTRLDRHPTIPNAALGVRRFPLDRPLCHGPRLDSRCATVCDGFRTRSLVPRALVHEKTPLVGGRGSRFGTSTTIRAQARIQLRVHSRATTPFAEDAMSLAPLVAIVLAA